MMRKELLEAIDHAHSVGIETEYNQMTEYTLQDHIEAYERIGRIVCHILYAYEISINICPQHLRDLKNTDEEKA